MIIQLNDVKEQNSVLQTKANDYYHSMLAMRKKLNKSEVKKICGYILSNRRIINYCWNSNLLFILKFNFNYNVCHLWNCFSNNDFITIY